MATEVEFVGAQIPAEIKAELQRRADVAERSLAAEIRLALRAWVGAPIAEERAA